MSRGDAAFHLLYADGNPDCREAVEAAFEPEWAVTTVETAKAAGEHVDADIDCLVAAADLPDTDPISLYESLDDSESIPVVLFADEPSAATVRAAYRAGIDDVIYKPTGERDDAAARSEGQPAGSGAGQPGAPTAGEAESAAESALATPTTAAARLPDGIAGLRDRLQELLTAHQTTLQGTTLNVSRSLMSAAADEVDVKIEWALQSLATELDATQCLLYEYDEDSDTLTESFGWRDAETDGSGVTDETAAPIGEASIPTAEFPGFAERLQQFEAVCYDPTSPADDAEFDAEQGTVLALPIIIEWQLTGAIVVTTDFPRQWTETIRQQLTAVGELIGHTERRRRRRTELKQQNERLEQFTSVISHDLQNPLSVVTGYLELAKDTGDTDHLDPAVDAAQRMEQMLNELLTLAREGRAVGDTEPVDIPTVVAQAWSSVDTPEATLTTEALESLPQVSADPTRLKEAFENLFRNALDHVGEDVAITVEAAADGNGVAVVDDGPGIPPEQRDEVFEHGYTGGNGTGLGLSIVETIIEGHGWAIWIDDNDGGARFIIEFDDE